MRDRLIKLLGDFYYTIESMTRYDIEEIADHLLANGVIVPPCKVGDTVWFNTYKRNATVCVGIKPHRVDRVDITIACDTKKVVETNIHSWEFGKTVFLTREEAEKALKGE